MAVVSYIVKNGVCKRLLSVASLKLPFLWKRYKIDECNKSPLPFSYDQATIVCGNREFVGYGTNGSPGYADRLDYPIPSIRYREPTHEMCTLREKERCDWKKLTIDEKKQLYRYSFCQTFSEMKAPTGCWKFPIAMLLWACAVAWLPTFAYAAFLYDDPPETFNEDRRVAQLKRIIGLEMNPVEGISSKWDYENNKWK